MEREVAFRAACLDPAKVACQLFAFDEKDRAGAIDFADAGNIESTLPPCRRPAVAQLRDPRFSRNARCRPNRADGWVGQPAGARPRVRARLGRQDHLRNFAAQARAGIETVVAMSREISRVRDPRSRRIASILFIRSIPEGWLESQVRAHPETIDASLRSVPIYGQVPIFSGAERGVIDLLGIDHTGRLVVIEIKATADLQLPFQALDYWLRVRKHLRRRGFRAARLLRRTRCQPGIAADTAGRPGARVSLDHRNAAGRSGSANRSDAHRSRRRLAQRTTSDVPPAGQRAPVGSR